MVTPRNRFSLTLPFSPDNMDTHDTNTPSPSQISPSPTTSSHSTPTKKAHSDNLGASIPESPLPTPRSCFEDEVENHSTVHKSFFDKARQFTRVFNKSPKHDTPSSAQTTSDQGIDYIQFDPSSTLTGGMGKSPAGLFVPFSSEASTSSRPTTACSSKSAGRNPSKRSASNLTLDPSRMDTSLERTPFKFARHTENVPSEGSSSSGSTRPLQAAATSGHRLKKSRRRKSLLDLASIYGHSSKHIPAEHLIPSKENEDEASLKRSRSLWNHPRHSSHDSFDATTAAFQARYWQNFGNESPLGQKAMSSRQRALNVKRARKMAQVFGEEPPLELYQITDCGEEDELADNRDSIATSYSLSSTNLLSNIQTEHLETEEEPPSPPREVDTPRTRRVRLEVDEFVDLHPTPPPFSSITKQHNHVRRVSSSISEEVGSDSLGVEFKERRRRAAKLSRFFGVGYHEFTQALVVLPQPPPPPAVQLEAPSSVEVRVGQPGWFGGPGKVKQTNVSDVIGKLRELR